VASETIARLLVVQIRELAIPDAYEITPQQFSDDRGLFLEWYRFDRLSELVGHSLELKQANTSVSHRGVVRGIHFSDMPPGQAKYVTVTHGAVLDFVVDIRVDSPHFGQWDAVLLDDTDRRSLYLSEGLGHAFVALTDDATVSYLVSSPFHPDREHGINPTDERIGLVFPPEAGDLVFSPKDAAAPDLEQAEGLGILPSWSEAQAYYDVLNRRL
jgi:dTDP-4-dehydrorhamnose 3,5-epimerase